jgi:hypothetical protein
VGAEVIWTAEHEAGATWTDVYQISCIAVSKKIPTPPTLSLPPIADRVGIGPWEGEISRSRRTTQKTVGMEVRARWRQVANRIQEEWELLISH